MFECNYFTFNFQLGCTLSASTYNGIVVCIIQLTVENLQRVLITLDQELVLGIVW